MLEKSAMTASKNLPNEIIYAIISQVILDSLGTICIYRSGTIPRWDLNDIALTLYCTSSKFRAMALDILGRAFQIPAVMNENLEYDARDVYLQIQSGLRLLYKLSSNSTQETGDDIHQPPIPACLEK